MEAFIEQRKIKTTQLIEITALRVWTKKDIEFKFAFYSHECVDAVQIIYMWHKIQLDEPFEIQYK